MKGAIYRLYVKTVLSYYVFNNLFQGLRTNVLFLFPLLLFYMYDILGNFVHCIISVSEGTDNLPAGISAAYKLNWLGLRLFHYGTTPSA